jgi:uncharacterized membrane protein YphA (DoxX/SURF4 family)
MEQTQSKRDKIIYWVATLWLSLGMVSTGIPQLLGLEAQISFVVDMGYPSYFLALLGAWKLLGTVAILVPRFPLVKEWAYAGFFFSMSGAVFSHIATHHGIADMFGPMLLIVLTIVSWYFRPASRRVGKN